MKTYHPLNYVSSVAFRICLRDVRSLGRVDGASGTLAFVLRRGISLVPECLTAAAYTGTASKLQMMMCFERQFPGDCVQNTALGNMGQEEEKSPSPAVSREKYRVPGYEPRAQIPGGNEA